MSVNTAHANNGVLIHSGEYILLHSDCVTMDFTGQDNPVFKGSKQGRVYLTSHRMIFNNKKSADSLQSFSAPFIALSDVELEQPVFGANYIKGKVRAQPNGNFVGETKFKLYFKSGGAIEYGQALLRAARTAQSNVHNGRFNDDPPPYTPAGAWHEAPPPAYQPPPGYYGWLPQHDAFTGPAPNTVFITDNPPPYPGIGGPPAYVPPPINPWQDPGCRPQHPTAPQAGWAAPAPPPSYGFPNCAGQPAAPQYPGMHYPYPPNTGNPNAVAFSHVPNVGPNCAPPSQHSKEAEALASAFNTPYNQHNNQGHGGEAPPPAYNDLPPSNYYDPSRRNQ